MLTVFIDTAPLIYLCESRDTRAQGVHAQLTRWIEQDAELLSSTLTLVELLVHPKRQGDSALALQYRRLLGSVLSGPLLPLDEKQAELAAELRARHGLRTPDAIQAATAIGAGCDVFYTNDQALTKLTELQVILVAAEGIGPPNA